MVFFVSSWLRVGCELFFRFGHGISPGIYGVITQIINKGRKMKKILFGLLLCLAASYSWADEPITTVYGFKALTIDNQPATLSSYKGKVLLIVNVASKCGFTPQYAGWKSSTRNTRTRV